MKVTIYREANDAINYYSGIKKSVIFSLIKENLYGFNKEVIYNKFTIKLKEVLSNLHKSAYNKSENPLFNVSNNIDLVKEFAEYLEFRYDYDYSFNRILIQDWGLKNLEGIPIWYLKILQNRFLDSRAFYISGFFGAPKHTYPSKIGISDRFTHINGYYGSEALAILPSYLKEEFITKAIVPYKPKFVVYGKLSYDLKLGVNIINIEKVYYE